MEQFEPVVRDGTLSLEMDEFSLDIGDVDTIVEVIGGGTTRFGTTRHSPANRDGTLTVDVRDEFTSMTHTEEVVADLQDCDTGTDRYGYPTRTVERANRFVDILEGTSN